MPRFSLTISDLEGYEVRAVAELLDTLDAPRQEPVSESDDFGAPPQAARTLEKRGRKVKGAAPATLPANTASPAPVPAAAAPIASAEPVPVAAAAPAAAPAPVPEPAPAPAAVVTGPTMDTLIAKARQLGTGPLGQSALLGVLNAMAAPSLPKVPEVHYPALDALLDAAIAYSGTPAPTKEWFKTVCQTGQYQAATATLIEAVNAAMGL